MEDEPGSSRSSLPGCAAASERLDEKLRAVLDATVDAVVVIDADGSILNFNDSASRMFGYALREVMGRDVSMLLPPEVRAHRDECLARCRGTRERNVISTSREVVAYRRGGTRFPALLSVSATDEAGLIVGCLRDLSTDKALQEEILHIAALEQQRIGQELHDGTQQELTGLGLLAQNLSEQLREDGSGAAELAGRLAAGIAEANRRVRSVARGLVPVPVDADTLPAALADLARSTQESYKLACRFESRGRLRVPDAATATHLYRIAQEAVGNAARHARADAVLIRLSNEGHRLRLEIHDNGIGIRKRRGGGEGVGLRLMEHRCAAIGGRFRLEAGAGCGTIVSCTVSVPGGS
ncbi:MAG TPA: PAS domain S-box protein [Steroidobacteraceae bacterium]|nr:PAS domain S-box protein [Steroidobacteraceae bacterium]